MPVATVLPNNNSSIQFTQLANGHLALVFNDIRATEATEQRASLYDDLDDGEQAEAVSEPQPGGRTAFWETPRAPMTLAISKDNGRTWSRRDIETGDGYCLTNDSRTRANRELSYPSVKQTADGALHIAFTHFRQAIKYVRVGEDWVIADTK